MPCPENSSRISNLAVLATAKSGSPNLLARGTVLGDNSVMHWLYLTLAILSEVAGTTCMKLSAGFTRPTPSALMWLFYGVCFYFLTLSLKKVDVSVAYAIWSGVGTALIATIGVLYFREPVTTLKIVGLVAIIGGVIALNISGGTR